MAAFVRDEALVRKTEAPRNAQKSLAIFRNGVTLKQADIKDRSSGHHKARDGNSQIPALKA